MLIIRGKEVFTTLEELVDPKHTALLLIDMQNGYVTQGGLFDRLGEDRSAVLAIVPRVKRVLEVARSSGVFIIYVQMTRYPELWTESPASLRMFLLRSGYQEGDPTEKLPSHTNIGTRDWAIVDEVAPLQNEVIVRKHRPSAFIGTDMDQILRSNGIKTVVLVGAVTEGCVMATAKDAQLMDYYTMLVQDCVGSGNKKNCDAALLLMSRDMDLPSSEDVIKIWKAKISKK